MVLVGGGGITMLCGIVRVQVDTGFVTIIITSVLFNCEEIAVRVFGEAFEKKERL